ncbi:type II toxin-antitoxin system death-on-curing family toxin [Bowdeniella massiliensis]|uniref:type II toxin-antitoxin system death-on-curing family toxin n=1 Tax=Bowdeniella massiliensis TaxID=2932264 RepID=UPI002027EB92|nr:type II toxin-antitoxin system death-on-curing family toxin [Bowdeniella massiliensis]
MNECVQRTVLRWIVSDRSSPAVSASTRPLPLSVVVHIIEAEGIGPVRDIGLLQSSLDRPLTTIMGTDAYPGVPRKAAALLHSVCNNHPLVDGNKRLAAIASLVFAETNNHRCDLTNDELFDLIMEVASGALSDVEQISERLGLINVAST